jgi:hypothetical protein
VQVEDAHVATKSEQRDQETDLLSTRSAISMSAASESIARADCNAMLAS